MLDILAGSDAYYHVGKLVSVSGSFWFFCHTNNMAMIFDLCKSKM